MYEKAFYNFHSTPCLFILRSCEIHVNFEKILQRAKVLARLNEGFYFGFHSEFTKSQKIFLNTSTKDLK